MCVQLMHNGVHSHQPNYQQVGFILYGHIYTYLYEVRKHENSNLIKQFFLIQDQLIII